MSREEIAGRQYYKCENSPSKNIFSGVFRCPMWDRANDPGSFDLSGYSIATIGCNTRALCFACNIHHSKPIQPSMSRYGGISTQQEYTAYYTQIVQKHPHTTRIPASSAICGCPTPISVYSIPQMYPGVMLTPPTPTYPISTSTPPTPTYPTYPTPTPPISTSTPPTPTYPTYPTPTLPISTSTPPTPTYPTYPTPTLPISTPPTSTPLTPSSQPPSYQTSISPQVYTPRPPKAIYNPFNDSTITVDALSSMYDAIGIDSRGTASKFEKAMRTQPEKVNEWYKWLRDKTNSIRNAKSAYPHI